MASQEQGRKDPDVTFRFCRDPAAPRGARRALDPLLPPDDPIGGAVRLAASELVTNVIQHTNDGGTMYAWDPQPDVPLRLEVSDRAPAELRLPQVPPTVGGRGLAIVQAVSHAWGVERTGVGKTVWAEFDRNRIRDAPPER